MDDTKKILTAIGISGGVLTLVFLAGMSFVAYRNYFEVVKLKLEIAVLRQDLQSPPVEKIVQRP